ncbi:hypothetical protein ED236_06870 [Pseudomethylobacillus aquaticus]|uniref:FlgO domain-containing protein n=1 Tax=Pseudomethylobacillus aquaticus TaxID=2676064 RepID=A0A3N0V036_9PROT|nr:FlgO family outer membrane protein [Pseudomethylobacillus aquaticus]ROH86167.1 hypothetical protein ED236_06870 [Pseudomethylobacillus aquaticus]
MLLGCNTYSSNLRNKNISGEEFINRNHKAVDSLTTQMSGKVHKDYPIVISTIVNMNQLSQTSSFGRLLTEQISGRFTQQKYSVVEMKMRNDVLIKDDQGEFLLTRELKDLATSVSSQAVVVGTYAVNGTDVFVNLKVVQPNTNLVLAASSYSIPKTRNMVDMLR